MSTIYKLGDGPINYDWNPRYVSVEGTEVFYSPSQNDKDKKTINVYEGAVSNICKIKGKSFAFCVILPPPTNKSLYFACDNYDETLALKNKILRATLNNFEKDEYSSQIKSEHRLSTKNLKSNKLKFPSNKNINPDISRLFTENIPDEFFQKIEQLKNEVLLDDNKFLNYFKGDLKVSVPENFINKDYLSLIKKLFLKFLSLISVLVIFYYIVDFLILFIFRNYVSFGTAWDLVFRLMLVLYLFFKYIKKILQLLSCLKTFSLSENNDSDYVIKGSILFDNKKDEIFTILCNNLSRPNWDNFVSLNDFKVKKDNPDQFITKFSSPSNNIIFQIINDNHLMVSESISLELIKFSDSNKNLYVVVRESDKNKSNYTDLSFFEIFVLVPIRDTYEEKTLVIFLTNFNPYKLFSNNTIPTFLSQKIKEDRLSIITILKEYTKLQNINYLELLSSLISNKESSGLKKFSSLYNEPGLKINSLNSIPTHPKSKNYREATNSQSNRLINEEFVNTHRINTESIMETVQSCHSNSEWDEDLKDNKYKINPESIITNGERLTIEDRFPGYVKNPQGGIECRNYEELKTQDGLILEIMKRAGKQLIEGKNMVGVSLPVRIFEPRSTLERITDIWGGGPLYLNKISYCSDPVERMKLFITFVISGLHMNLKQLKPFNPILGETLQGHWPDGSHIYEEHVSHHPPIARFLILSGNKKWKFYGYYEFVVKLKSLTGNVIGGHFRGPNFLELDSGEKLQFTYPFMNISGLMYGRRNMEWEGSMKFENPSHNISAEINFTPAPGIFQKFKEPTDIFRGELKKGNQILHKIYGSPVDKLLFDGEM
jgi:hypothetical protein